MELPHFTRDIDVEGFGPESFIKVHKILPLLTASSPEHSRYHIVMLSLPGYSSQRPAKSRASGLHSMLSGGHFAMHEKLQELVDDLRKMFGKGRPVYGVVPRRTGYSCLPHVPHEVLTVKCIIIEHTRQNTDIQICRGTCYHAAYILWEDDQPQGLESGLNRHVSSECTA
ncbi:hypothetical protein EDD18DRAFT_1105686 [Armillaria luteobubalina]|uniref:Uncharacterized protein n=1 Tax=Armillaria luteobubalina TaxID=153913 RepID=A0AA39Q7H8_9AGAR|nr:hypothetical protein EDD18DRAFT_1105686 [Armillaria luteobubalina]